MRGGYWSPSSASSPAPTCRSSSARILRQDASLAAPTAPAPQPTNLPAPPTPLVGRELELAAVTSLLGREEVRLLTLTGAGGTGKTRLALAAAQELVPAFADGVWFVPLAPLADPALVEPTVAAALGVEESGAGSLTEALHEHLRARQALVVLDNFEHLTAAAPVAAGLLAAAPGLKLLVTSRALLRLSGEHDYPVPPLSLPGAATTAEERSSAARRSRSSSSGPARSVATFSLEEHAPAVAEICVALDGLPLALELAAARTKVLSPEALRDRLERRLPLLERGPRRPSAAAADPAGHDRLEPRPARRGGAAAVRAPRGLRRRLDARGGRGRVRREPRRAHLARRAEPRAGPARGDRFSMLQTVREYALERLDERGEADDLRRRHAQHFVDLAEAAEAELTPRSRRVARPPRRRARQPARRSGLDRRHRRERARAAARDRLAQVLADAGPHHRGPPLARGGDRPRAPARLRRLRARALAAEAALIYDEAELGRARALLEEALELFRAVEDEREAARALSELGGIAALEEDYVRASALFEETIPIFRAAGDTRALLVTLGNLASVTDLGGDHVRGRALGRGDARARPGGRRSRPDRRSRCTTSPAARYATGATTTPARCSPRASRPRWSSGTGR